ncbi:MAG: hypothetical protein DI607_14510 [Sphingomonas hengshuiensis]|nr:MAG: hypothetical protein DI607_14510 [Sphingomonas hengshuiensis]
MGRQTTSLPRAADGRRTAKNRNTVIDQHSEKLLGVIQLGRWDDKCPYQDLAAAVLTQVALDLAENAYDRPTFYSAMEQLVFGDLSDQPPASFRNGDPNATPMQIRSMWIAKVNDFRDLLVCLRLELKWFRDLASEMMDEISHRSPHSVSLPVLVVDNGPKRSVGRPKGSLDKVKRKPDSGLRIATSKQMSLFS